MARQMAAQLSSRAAPGLQAGGRVVWVPARSLWFGTIAVVALVGATLTFTRSALVLFAVSTAFTLCAGHSVGIHRGLIHRAFRAPLPLERALVYVGVLIGLGGPIGLVRMHHNRDIQQNHAACHDYFAHRRAPWRDYFWNLHCEFRFADPFHPLAVAPPVAADITGDRFYRFLERTWRWQQVPLALIAFAIGGWSWLVWGIFMRITVSTFGHWFVGYVAHRTGYRVFHNRGAAVQGFNSLLLGAVSMGEGWHNNHHAYPRSARLGIRWWELDLGFLLIAALRAAGLAHDVLLPGPATRTAAASASTGQDRPLVRSFGEFRRDSESFARIGATTARGGR